jgi:hypothetical protein
MQRAPDTLHHAQISSAAANKSQDRRSSFQMKKACVWHTPSLHRIVQNQQTVFAAHSIGIRHETPVHAARASDFFSHHPAIIILA